MKACIPLIELGLGSICDPIRQAEQHGLLSSKSRSPKLLLYRFLDAGPMLLYRHYACTDNQDCHDRKTDQELAIEKAPSWRLRLVRQNLGGGRFH
jgi:hypothetical protein